MAMESAVNGRARNQSAAFSLIEMVAVIAILVVLMTAGIALMGSTGAQSRKAGTDMLIGLVEQARSTAITSRSTIVLAISEPGDLYKSGSQVSANENVCRVGMFKVVTWDPTAKMTGSLLKRWQSLNSGLVMNTGRVDGFENPMDSAKVEIAYGTQGYSIKGNLIAIDSRGRLLYPAATSAPIVIRLAEGGYRGSPLKASVNKGQGRITENVLKIGRAIARPYRID